MISELIEVLFQCFVLLIYTGVQIFEKDNNVNLAQSPIVIQSYATIIGCNIIFAGVLWLLYVFAPNRCYGIRFHTFIFSIDTTFEVVYTVFPMSLISYH